MNIKSIAKLIEKTFTEETDSFLSHVAVNCIVFSYHHPNLKVMVLRIKKDDSWSLPGGYVKMEENLEEAAQRNLHNFGISKVFLKQIYTFGDAFRVPKLEESKSNYSERTYKILQWISQRFVTVAFYGLSNYEETEITDNQTITEVRWMNVDKLENLIQDHADIIKKTRKILINELLYNPVAANLLPETFTLNELRGLYESILNRTIDRGTFRRKILSLGIVEKVDKRKDALGRPAHLFRFNSDKYHNFLAEETKFGF